MTDAHHALQRTLMELASLFAEIQALARHGDRARYFSDSRYRWAIHRLGIVVGNEVHFLGPARRSEEPWGALRKFRNELAHLRLPDIDDDGVRRVTVLRPTDLIDRLARIPG